MRSAFVVLCLVLAAAVPCIVCGKVVDFGKAGGRAGDESFDTCVYNTGLLNATFRALQSGDTLLFPAGMTFWFQGGIYGSDIENVVIQIDGTLKWTDDEKTWPRDKNGNVFECMMLENLVNVTFTSSSGVGMLDGNGLKWWGAVKYLEIQENRPRLFHIWNGTNLLFERILFKNSPYHTFYAINIAHVEIRNCDIDARRTNLPYHDLLDLTAFNTDGFDVAGFDVWIHDCNIWNDDDCIAVKEVDRNSVFSCSQDMLFERINASGVGLTIGSIGASCIKNITFRNCVMPNTFKGLYMKSRPMSPGDTGSITDVLYENIEIINPTQWAIWIGPQQASYSDACSLLWPAVPGAKCPVPSSMTWNNIVLRNITITKPKMSPGVILGNSTNPMLGIVFDNVVVTDPGTRPWGDKFYACDGVKGAVATGSTSPVPPCFNQGV